MLLIMHSYIKLVLLGLTEPCRLSAWYQFLFHFAYTFAHILPNATLAFAVLVLVINAHYSGETAFRVDEFIK